MSPLPFHLAIEEHWREHRPTMVRELEQQGQLKIAIEQAAARTAEAESAAIRNGMAPDAAREMFREHLQRCPSRR